MLTPHCHWDCPCNDGNGYIVLPPLPPRRAIPYPFPGYAKTGHSRPDTPASNARPFTRCLEPFPFRWNRNGALDSCFDAFSSREPVSTSLENALELDATRQGAVHDEVRSRDEAGGTARQKYHRIRHLLRRTHAAGRVEGQRRLVQFGIAVLDRVPDPAFEIGVARRHRIGADTLGR